MRGLKQKFYGVLLGVGLLYGGMTNAQAGQYADVLARCLVNSASEQDNIVMLKWIYAVIGINKNLQGLSSVSDVQRQQYAKQVGAFFSRAYQDTCKSQVSDTLLFEGHNGISHAGEIFGGYVMSKVFQDTAVLSALRELRPPVADKSSVLPPALNVRPAAPAALNTTPSNKDDLPTY